MRLPLILLVIGAASLGAQPAHLDAGRPGVTRLMMAAFEGADVVPLLRSGARADETAADGMTALLFASLHGSPETVEALLDAGASLKTRNRNGMTALLLAAEYNPDARVVALLVKRGAAVNDRDGRGRTPLIAAAGRNNADVIEVLLAAGADPRAEDHDHRTAALYAQYGNGKLAGTPTFWKLYQRQY